MSRLLPSAIAIGLAACVGGSLATRLTDTSPAPAPDVFECARGQLKAAGFAQSSYDAEMRRVTGRKYDETQRRPDTQFRRMVDRLEVQVDPAASSGLSAIEVEATTFAEMTTQRGPTEVQEKASTTARSAAQSIIEKCRQPADSTSVPG